jgi:hypothetical protein
MPFLLTLSRFLLQRGLGFLVLHCVAAYILKDKNKNLIKK